MSSEYLPSIVSVVRSEVISRVLGALLTACDCSDFWVCGGEELGTDKDQESDRR